MFSSLMKKNEKMEDEEFDTDIEEENNKKVVPRSTKEVYLDACQKTGSVPSSKFLRQCETSAINLKHYGIGDKGAKAVSMALRSDSVVTTLNLHDNSIRESGGIWIAKCLKHNCCLGSLDLSGNPIGTKGADAVADALLENGNLMELSLKDCGLQDKGMNKLAHSLELNSFLRKLDLSYNDLGDKSATLIGSVLCLNRYLESVDLSWNSIRSKGASDLAVGLTENKRLKEFNLSWNGLSDGGAEGMEAALISNTSLESLDVSSNSFTVRGAQCFAQGLKLNRNLEILRVGRNPFQSAGARLLLDALKQNPSSSLQELHLNDIVFDKDCVMQLESLLEERPSFFCSWDVSIQGLRISKSEKPELVDMFFSFVHNRGLRMIDLYRILTREHDAQFLGKENFVSGMKKLNVSLKDRQLRETFDILDRDGSGFIAFQEFKACKSDWYKTRTAFKETHNDEAKL